MQYSSVPTWLAWVLIIHGLYVIFAPVDSVYLEFTLPSWLRGDPLKEERDSGKERRITKLCQVVFGIACIFVGAQFV